MELVFENGQILAKEQRSNVFSPQNLRTISIMDLYEAEYNEDFKKSSHGDGTIKNHVETQVVPNHHVDDAGDTNMIDQERDFCESNDNEQVDESKKMMADNENRENIEFIPPDEQSTVRERSIDSYFSTYFTEDTEGSTYLLSSSQDDDSDDARRRVPGRRRKDLVKRKQSTEAYSSCSSVDTLGSQFHKKLRALQDLMPNPHQDDEVTALKEVIDYVTALKNQVQMTRMGNGYGPPPRMMPFGPYYSHMGLPMGMGMHMGVPHFLNHPGLMPMRNYPPMENYPPQVVPPARVASPDEMPNSTSLQNSDDATTYTSNQGTGTDGEILSAKKSEKP